MTDADPRTYRRAADRLAEIRGRLATALRGKQEVVSQVVSCLVARAHVLLEDVPGLGKTTLAKALADAVGGGFSRLQCTPDLLPGDVTGFSVFDQKTREFEFRPGPVFADVLLVDEINRATPRTQSALLEAMAEGQVTADNVRHRLSPTFFVMATQNPVEHAGTYPLPEAQLDRFGMKLSIGYPSPDHESAMLEAAAGENATRPASPSPVIEAGELEALTRTCASVACGERVRSYLVRLASMTRDRRAFPQISLGVSPRGLLTWQRLAQARALADGRSYVTDGDVQDVALPVLRVRLGVRGEDVDAVSLRILQEVPV